MPQRPGSARFVVEDCSMRMGRSHDSMTRHRHLFEVLLVKNITIRSTANEGLPLTLLLLLMLRILPFTHTRNAAAADASAVTNELSGVSISFSILHLLFLSLLSVDDGRRHGSSLRPLYSIK